MGTSFVFALLLTFACEDLHIVKRNVNALCQHTRISRAEVAIIRETSLNELQQDLTRGFLLHRITATNQQLQGQIDALVCWQMSLGIAKTMLMQVRLASALSHQASTAQAAAPKTVYSASLAPYGPHEEEA